MAKMNGREDRLEYTPSEKKSNDGSKEKVNILDLFRGRTIALRSANMHYQWFSVTLAYFGLTFASTTLSASPYGTFLFSVLAEIPACFLNYFATDFLGRRFILSVLQATSGVSCLIAGGLILIPHEDGSGIWILRTLLVMLGKLGASSSFGKIFIKFSTMHVLRVSY